MSWGPRRGVHESSRIARISFGFVKFVLIRGQSIGASRKHETARCAAHESPRMRDAKASGPLVETRKRFAPRSNSQLAEAKGAGLRISWIIADLSWVIEALNKEEKEFRIEFSFCEMVWGTGLQ